MIAKIANAENYHWFDIGELGNDLEVIDGGDPIASRLPFSKCAMAYTEGGDPGVFIMTEIGDGIRIAGLASNKAQWFEIIPLTIYHTDQGYFGEGEGATNDQIRAMLVNLAYCMRRIDAGISASVITPSKSHINATRKAKGKGPLKYDWRTVIIEPRPAQTKIASNGTHASPRQHDRRGHWRNCKNGKRVFVKQCTVGDASKGNVFKDYMVKT